MSVHNDPLKLSRQQRALDCGDPSCFGICDLGPLPGEPKAVWLARIKARFAGTPIPPIPPLPGSPFSQQPVVVPIRIRPTADTLVDCERCGEPRWYGRACQACRTATRLKRRPAV